MSIHEFEAVPGTRVRTLYGEIEFDKHGRFQTSDPAVAQDVAAHLKANPALTEGPAAEAEEPYEGWKVAELKAELDERGLETKGNRADLVERLVADDQEEAAEAEGEGGETSGESAAEAGEAGETETET